MEMPRPTEAHRRLHALAGDWTGTEKMHPSPWDPQGGTAEGRVQNRVALDGFAIVQQYEQRRGGQISFSGHGVFSWDAAAGSSSNVRRAPAPAVRPSISRTLQMDAIPS